MTLSTGGDHITFSIPLGAVAPSGLAGLRFPTGVFPLSFAARACLNELPTAGTFVDF